MLQNVMLDLLHAAGRLLVGLALPVGLALLVAPVPGNAQSTVVVPPAPTVEPEDPGLAKGSLPNSLSPQLLRVESLLAAPTPNAWRSKMEVRQLVRLMNSASLPVVLDPSAADNQLQDTTPLRLALRNASIDSNLRFALRAFQCDYVITDSGVIRILSEDAMLQHDGLSQVTYNIGRLARDYDRAEGVMDLVGNAIDPDSWSDLGGIAYMHITNAKNGFLLTVTHTYQHQRQVRQLLASTVILGGGAADEIDPLASFDGTTQPVLLPEEYLALRRNRRGMSLPGSGTTSGFGGGGAIRGGGVF